MLLASATVLMTWPQALFLSSKVAAHSDPFFSIWRLGWISHAIRAGGRGLFDANIFFPEPRTLAYSDAALLEGIVGAPLIRAGVHPIAVYNVLLLFGIFASAAAMFWLCVRLTGSTQAATLAALIFGFAPYRIEHFMHLELQWTMWMPLSLVFLHRTLENGSAKSAVLAGLCIGFQFLSCVYYGLFLSLLIGVAGALAVASRGGGRITSVLRLAAAAVVALAIVVPYSRPYRENARSLGDRNVSEIGEYSASLSSYLASSQRNWLYGWTADRFGSNEARLFPGLVGVVLAAASFFSRSRRDVWLYAVWVLMSVELSFGLRGHLYPFLHEHFPLLRSLRAPARFGILALCGLSVLAGFGADCVLRRFSNAKTRALAFIAGAVLIAVEFASFPMLLTGVDQGVPPVYQLLRSLDSGVVVELPVPPPDRLPGSDPQYVYWSTTHWRPMINGYSGYYPRGYLDTLDLMTRFPSEESIARLKSLGVRYLLLHRALYDDTGRYEADLLSLIRRDDFIARGTLRDWLSDATLLEIR